MLTKKIPRNPYLTEKKKLDKAKNFKGFSAITRNLDFSRLEKKSILAIKSSQNINQFVKNFQKFMLPLWQPGNKHTNFKLYAQLYLQDSSDQFFLDFIFEKIKNELDRFISFSPEELIQLFENALKGSPYIILSINDYLKILESFGFQCNTYCMHMIMIYVYTNNFHQVPRKVPSEKAIFEKQETKWHYVGSTTLSATRAERQYTSLFAPDLKSNLLSEYHAGEIKEAGLKVSDKIIF